MVSHLILISTFFQDDGKLKDRIYSIYPYTSVYAPFAVWIFFLVFNCTALLLLGQLYVFHTMLQNRNLTTYEHIVQDYRTQRSIARRLEDMEAERAESIVRAQSEHDTTKVIQLKMGKFCREHGMPYFDIMHLPPEPDPEAGFANIFGESAAPDPVDNGHQNFQNDITNEKDIDIIDDIDDEVEVTDYANHDDNNQNGENDHERGENQNNTLVDTDISIRSNTSRSNRTSKSKNELHDIMYDGDQQQPPNYVELTLSGKNDYYDEAENDVGGQDGAAEHDDVAGGLDTSASQYYDEDEVDGDGDGQEYDDEQASDEDAVDGIFIDYPDDVSHKSGCSGRSLRSVRSGRSGRSSKSGRTGSKLADRDLTAF